MTPALGRSDDGRRLVKAFCIIFVCVGSTLCTSLGYTQGEPNPPPTPEQVESGRSTGDNTQEDADDTTPTQADDAPIDESKEPPIPPVPGAPEREGAVDTAPREQYKSSYLVVERVKGDVFGHIFEYGTTKTAKRGTHAYTVYPPDFYESVGRPDLQKKYRRRFASRMIFLATSFSVGILGPYFLGGAGAAIEPFCVDFCTPEEERRQRQANTLYGLAGASLGAGIVSFVAGMFLWSTHPVDLDTRNRLAREHNEALRRDLGLPEMDMADKPRGAPVRVGVSAGPRPWRRGAVPITDLLTVSRYGLSMIKSRTFVTLSAFVFSASLCATAFAQDSDDADSQTHATANLDLDEDAEAGKKSIQQQQEYLEELFEDIAPSVISVVRKDGSLGTAFFVDQNGLALTHARVVGDQEKVDVVLEDGRRMEAEVVERAGASVDLALLDVGVGKTKPLLLTELGEVRVGSWLGSVTHGYAKGLGFQVGTLSSLPSDDRRPGFQIQMPLSTSATGAPIFDVDGHVIGVADAGIGDPRGINLATRSDAALENLGELRARCLCLRIQAPEGKPIFVDGRIVGKGPNVTVLVRPGEHEVFSIIKGRMKKMTIEFPEQQSVELP